jgi:hypothetical protein
MIAESLCRIAGVLALSLAVAATASAKYGGNPGMGGGTSGGTTTAASSNSYGYGSSTGKAVGSGVGVAAATVGVALLVRHHHKAQSSEVSLTGCTHTLMNGLSVTDENDHLTYTLLGTKSDLQAGELVELKGTVGEDEAGARMFRVREVVTNHGACGAMLAAHVN